MAVEQGYVHTLLEIEKQGLPLSDTFTAGPALAIKHAAEPGREAFHVAKNPCCRWRRSPR